MRDTLVLLLSLQTRQLSPLLRIVLGGPLVMASWAGAGGAVLESFSVILVTYVLALAWGIGLILLTAAAFIENARPINHGTLDLAAGRNAGKEAPARPAARAPRSLQSFAVPGEQPQSASQTPEKIRLPLRG